MVGLIIVAGNDDVIGGVYDDGDIICLGILNTIIPDPPIPFILVFVQLWMYTNK